MQDTREFETCQGYFVKTGCNCTISLRMTNQSCQGYGMTICCPWDWTIVVCIACWHGRCKKYSKYFRNTTLEHWKPFLHEDRPATLHHMGLQHIDAKHLAWVEKQLFNAGLKDGYSKQTWCKYKFPMHCESCALNVDKLPNVWSKSVYVLTLRQCINVNFVHGNLQPTTVVQQTEPMEDVAKNVTHTVVRLRAPHPPANDFAGVLENMFHGSILSNPTIATLTERN